MYVLIDNYDSFTYNLVHFMGELGAEIIVIRNDVESVDSVLARQPEAIILSPGPCTPAEAGICVPLIQAAAPDLPILGVCLGFQAINTAFGGQIMRAPVPVHGKINLVTHNQDGLFAGLATPLPVTRYHSLILDETSLPSMLDVTSRSEDGLIMAIKHHERPIFGVQFHPESIATQGGHRILANFMAVTGKNIPSPDCIAAAEAKLIHITK